MSRSKVLVISDDQEVIQKARNFAYSMGVNLEIYSIFQWKEKERKKAFDSSVQMLSSNGSKNIIPFPKTQGKGSVQTMNELEGIAIVNAIHQYEGNLTEAARALGIGRATLYRKVKQYNIDISVVRRKRAA